MSETRKLAAILVSDVVGYSRLAGADEGGTLARLRGLRSDLIDPAIATHHGRIVQRTGDGSIVEFRSVVDAVRCAIEIQNGLSERNTGLPPTVASNSGSASTLGTWSRKRTATSWATASISHARLEGIAKPGAICLSEDAYRQVKGRFEVAVSDLGATQLKNIAEPIRVYSLDVGARAQQKTLLRGVPDAAFARALDFLRRPLFPAALAVVLAAAGAIAWHSRFAPGLLNRSIAEGKLATAPRLSIVVLPFENLSGDPDQEYFVDGITDDLTTDLSRVPDSFVIARNTAFTYNGKTVDAKEIGRELGVRYLLEGSVRRTADMVEVNAQLVSTETGAHVWADRFEAERGDVGRLQFEIVARLAHSLGEELIKAESLRTIRERPRNPDAVDLATRGEAILLSNSFNRSAWNDAIKLFERALALDPQNMTALTALAVALDVRADNHWSEEPAGDIARAEELTNAAMALQPDDTFVHWAKARLFASKQQWRSALTEVEMAVADDRNNSRAYGDAGFYKMQLGRSQDGLTDVEIALRLDPHSNQAAEWQTRLCYLRAHLAQWEQAIEQCEKAVAAAPWDNISLADLAAAYASAGYDKEAKEIAVKLGERDPNFIQGVRKYMDAHDDPTFKAECARIIEGLRKAGVPERPVKTN